MKSSYKTIAICILSLLFLTSCVKVITNLGNKNYAALYNPGGSSLHPVCKIYHTADSTTLLYIKLNLNELIFFQTEDRTMKSKVKIHYRIYPSFEDYKLIDSSTTYLNIKRQQNQEELTTFVTLKPVKRSNYILEVYTTDLIRNKYGSYVTAVNKNQKNHQSFLFTNSDDYKIVFSPYLSLNKDYIVKHTNTNLNKIFLKFYNKKMLPSPPPFSISYPENLSIVPDSIWELPFSTLLKFDKKYQGIYLFQSDTLQKKGITKIIADKNFPEIKTPVEYIAPLRYLTSTEEYNELLKNSNKKFALDNFWLKAASGNVSQAKDLIRIFYNRVYYANLFFTTYAEGWKTDRGMIYIMFGPPKIVNKTNKYERWTYSSGTNISTITLTFEMQKNDYCENDYFLVRSIAYKNSWFKAIETWKSGKIFSF